jgi:hypothetical protein
MAAIPLCEAPLAKLKQSLRDELPHVKSSHLSEALACSLGFRTYAALTAAMTGPEGDRPFALLNTEQMCRRLVQLGYDDDPEFDFELTILKPVPGAVSTVPVSAHSINYKTARQKAWRNLMVCAVNEALERRLFTLRPGDNRFGERGANERTFDFALPNGLPARAHISDAGFDELEIHVAVNPKGRHVSAMAGFDVGDAVGMTWIERRLGVWLQSSDREFHCRRPLLAPLADLNAVPQGFGDKGGVIM